MHHARLLFKVTFYALNLLKKNFNNHYRHKTLVGCKPSKTRDLQRETTKNMFIKQALICVGTCLGNSFHLFQGFFSVYNPRIRGKALCRSELPACMVHG